jgi:Mn-dependent DtxR family transcriptional regulator
MIHHIKCSKEELLKYIRKRGMVENWEIALKYDFTEAYVRVKLNRLKKQGLVINLEPDHWELTVEGIRRVKRYVKGQRTQ